ELIEDDIASDARARLEPQLLLIDHLARGAGLAGAPRNPRDPRSLCRPHTRMRRHSRHYIQRARAYQRCGALISRHSVVGAVLAPDRRDVDAVALEPAVELPAIPAEGNRGVQDVASMLDKQAPQLWLRWHLPAREAEVTGHGVAHAGTVALEQAAADRRWKVA